MTTETVTKQSASTETTTASTETTPTSTTAGADHTEHVDLLVIG